MLPRGLRPALLLHATVALWAGPVARATADAPLPPDGGPEWAPLFAALAERGRALAGTFEERRYFSFREHPVFLAGEIRLSAEHGLSLHYPAEHRTVIIDRDGVLVRERAAPARAVAADGRAPAAVLALLHVLQFDPVALARDFEIRGARDGETWRLVLTPADGSAVRGVEGVVVTGRVADLERLELQRTARHRVEILVGRARTGVEFTPAELERFFR